MLVNRLSLTNVRAVETAEFSFGTGLNLIAGANGTGKSTVLDALSLCLNRVSSRVNGLRGAKAGLTAEDISGSADSLTVEMTVDIEGRQYSYLHLQPRDSVAGADSAISTPVVSRFTGPLPPVLPRDADQHPVALFFSTRRSVPSDRAPGKSVSAGGYQAALADAFSERELRLGEFADWLRAQDVLSRETTRPDTRILDAFDRAVERFLPGYTDIHLHIAGGPRPRLLVRKGDLELPVGRLSDGERGILALVFDLTRRLAQANPGVPDPAAAARGVVLIDEIDLHLHPRWQRDIVTRLPETFPNLQFIATTHSPQILGEVHPEQIQIMGHGPVFSPPYSFGIDSSRILEEIMDVPPRNLRVQELLRQLSDHVAAENHVRAQAVTEQLSDLLGDDDPEVIHARTLLDLLADDE